MKKYLGLGLAGMLVSLGLMVAGQWPRRDPEIIICDVGQGDGAVITQGFTQVVIDVGRDDGAMVACLGKTLPFWDKKIEGVIISHEDGDHAGGLLNLVEHYRVSQLVMTKMAARNLTLPEGVMVSEVAAGQELVWGGCRAEVFWPPEDQAGMTESNDLSLVLRTECGTEKTVWWAGDANEKIEQRLLLAGKVKQTWGLKVAHHGSGNATTKPFLDVLRPSRAVISVGENRYGHPADEVLTRLAREQVEVERTDIQANIRWRLNN